MISPIGYFIIPAGVILALFRPSWLLYGTAVLIAMPSVMALDVDVTRIEGHQIFGTLLILTYVCRVLLSRRNVVFEKKWRYIIPIIFVVYILFSWTRSVALSGDVLVFSETVGTWAKRVSSPTTLEFGWFNITQSIYPVYGVILYYVSSKMLSSMSRIRKFLRCFVYGAVLVALVQILFGVLYELGMSSVAREIYSLAGITGYNDPRASKYGLSVLVFSLAGEPGTSALMYLSSLSFLSVSRLSSKGKKRTTHYYTCVFILLIALITTGSTLAYVGLVITAIVYIFVHIRYISVSKNGSYLNFSRMLIKFGAVVGVIVLVFNLFQTDLLNTAFHVAKIVGDGPELTVRWKALYHSVNHIYTQYPVLGIGYGSHLSPVMLDAILANIGFIGLVIFILFVTSALSNAIKATYVRKENMLFMFGIVSMNMVYFFGVMIGIGAAGMALGSTWLLPSLAAAVKR